MKKLLYALFLIVLAKANTNEVLAQKKNFTMKEAVLGMGNSLAVKNLRQLQWMGKSDYYTQSITDGSVKAFLRTNANTNQSDTFVTLAQLNGLLSINESSLPSTQWLDEKSCNMTFSNNLIYKIIKIGANDFKTEIVLTETPKEATIFTLAPNEITAVFSEKENLFIQKGSTRTQITTDGSSDIKYGTSVHQNEFGIDGGLFWSPKGNALAFYRMDQSMIGDYPVVNWTETPPSVRNVRYPFAGRPSHHVTLGVYNVKTNKTIYVQTGEPKEQYLTTVTWSPDESFIYISILNRDQNHLKLNKYNATNGAFVQTLFEEKNERYVEPQNPLIFINNDPSQFIWWSQRNGFMHLYLYKSNGQLVKQLTNGEWLVNEYLGYNVAKNEIIISTSKGSPLQKNIFAVNLKNAKMRDLSNTKATHTAIVSPNGNYLIDNYTSKSVPRNIDIVNINSGKVNSILQAKSTLDDYAMAIVDDVVLKSDDNTTLYGKLMKPMNFDASKKYPVIVYLYNGPHVQLNKDSYPYSGNLWYDYMTQQGYLVFVMDGRGSANRGFEFESKVHRQLGTIEMEDQMVGINYLKTLKYVDAARMGIHGWSFGGFMTTSFMLRKPEIFKCGVAGGPVLDWSMYEIMYTERYMDTPQQNPEGYANNLLLDKTQNLKGKLLMIHGTEDDVVVWQHSLKFIKKCVDEGTQLDYFVYPGHPHNVKGKDRVHLMQKITDYFNANLK